MNLPLIPKKALKKSSSITFKRFCGKLAHQAISSKLQIWKLCKEFGKWLLPFVGIKKESALSC